MCKAALYSAKTQFLTRETLKRLAD